MLCDRAAPVKIFELAPNGFRSLATPFVASALFLALYNLDSQYVAK